MSGAGKIQLLSLREALIESGYVRKGSRAGWTEGKLVTSLLKVAESNPKTHGGLILFVDEMGKFLEGAAQDGEDIYIFQQLAEAASRSNGRFLVVGVLHQAFEEYANRLTHEMRDEWSKIQGRFIDLPVNAVGEEQLELISRAIESDRKVEKPSPDAVNIAQLVCRGKDADSTRLAMTLENCWPLHPVVACLLGPISRRRFGQNQRSIFGFLNSSEYHGFQDFLSTATEGDLYRPHELWNYLKSNLESSILVSPDGHRWALAVEALERCEASGGDGFHIDLLKTIAVVDLFKDRSGLVPNLELLQTCFPDTSKRSMEKGLKQLRDWSLTIFKKFQDADAIYAGSDFDIERAVAGALEEVGEIDFNTLKSLANIPPMLAKRHYHEVGAMRWFDVSVVPAKDLVEAASKFQPDKGVIGEFLLAIPTSGESEDALKVLCKKAARKSDEWNIIAGFSRRSWGISTLARELLALERVRDEHPELAGDAVARNEVLARLVELHTQLESEVSRSFDQAEWYQKHHSGKAYRQVHLSELTSDMAGKHFDQCPRIHNELLNRQKPSNSAVAAQNTLLQRMVNNEGESRLGIEGYPAEGGLFASLLEKTCLYVEQGDGWQFVFPSDAESKDPCRIYPAWEAAKGYIKKHRARPVSISEIYEEVWSQPPYGVNKGLVPVLSVAFILSQREKVATYRDGIFRARFEDIDSESLSSGLANIQLRWMDLDTSSRRLLSDLSEVVRELDVGNELKDLKPIDVGRGLVSIYDRFPQWTKRTMRLSSAAVQVRNIFKRANDPNKFLFDDIPSLVGKNATSAVGVGDDCEAVSFVKDGLMELSQAYPAMLHRLRDMMLEELQVPNLSPQSLSELKARAANAIDIAGDFRLDAFAKRLAEFDGSDEGTEGIASLAANKPPRDWIDADVDRATLEIADMSQQFLRAETFTRIKGRPEKRQSIAIVIGVEGRPVPIQEDFEITDVERKEVEELVDQLTTDLESKSKTRRIVLAALAEAGARLMLAQAAKQNEKAVGGR